MVRIGSQRNHGPGGEVSPPPMNTAVVGAGRSLAAVARWIGLIATIDQSTGPTSRASRRRASGCGRFSTGTTRLLATAGRRWRNRAWRYDGGQLLVSSPPPSHYPCARAKDLTVCVWPAEAASSGQWAEGLPLRLKMLVEPEPGHVRQQRREDVALGGR